jgi:hypothetical protein
MTGRFHDGGGHSMWKRKQREERGKEDGIEDRGVYVRGCFKWRMYSALTKRGCAWIMASIQCKRTRSQRWATGRVLNGREDMI